MAEKPQQEETVRETLERVVRERTAAAIPESSQDNSLWGRLELNEIIVFVTGELVALPFAFSGAEAFMKGDILQGLLAYAVAIPFAVGGLTFRLWKGRLGKTARTWMPVVLLPVAVVLAFAYLVGPGIYQRSAARMPVPDSHLPSQDAALMHQLADARAAIEKLRNVPAKSLPADTAKMVQLKAALDSEKRDSEKKDAQIAALEAKVKPTRPAPNIPRVALAPTTTASAAPTDASFVPTHVRLQFNSPDEKPSEIDAENIHWSWDVSVEKFGKLCGALGSFTKCFVAIPQGDRYDFDLKVVTLSLIFDKPIANYHITSNFNGAKLQWSIVDQNSRSAIIKILPQASWQQSSVKPDLGTWPTSFVLEVKMTTTTP